MAGVSGRFPRSPYDRVGGLLYFPRMTDKIRMHGLGELPEDYHANLGKGFDQRCCDFLHVSHEALAARVAQGGPDAEVLEWCFTTGRRPNESGIHIWNEYIRKCGWKDAYSPRLASRLEGLGMAGRSDVETMFDLIEVDEGRPPRGAGAGDL